MHDESTHNVVTYVSFSSSESSDPALAKVSSSSDANTYRFYSQY